MAEAGGRVTVTWECVFWWQPVSSLYWIRVKPYSEWEDKPLNTQDFPLCRELTGLHELV